jgi:hypothetical protein
MSDDVEESTSQKSLNYRLLGLGMLVVGGLLLLCFVGWPIYSARGGATEITIYKKLIGLGLILVVAGINGIVLGEVAFSWFPDGNTNLSDVKLATWLMLAVNGAVVCFAFFYLEEYLKNLGYDTSGL